MRKTGEYSFCFIESILNFAGILANFEQTSKKEEVIN